MTLNFPNRNRTYDNSRRAVRFWGHERVMECVFFMTEGALRRLRPNLQSDEAGFLSAFDANRELIDATAAKVYARGRRKASYDLLTSDF